jgi:ribosomal protein S13
MGAEELSKVSGVLTTGDTARKFLKLGIGLDAVGDATAQYLADSARYGITQGATTEQLTKKTQDYIVEVDKIARLTGQTREQQQREAQKSLVDARFRAKLAEMTANGQKDQADQLRLYVDGLGGAAGDAARALVTGIPLTKEAAEANLFTGDALRQNTQDIIAGNKRSVQAIADTEEAMSRGADTFGTLAQYGKDLGGLTVQSLDAKARIQNKTSLQRQQEISDAQEKTANAAGKTTEEFTDAQLATAGASKNLQSLGFSLATYAVPAVNKFASALESVTGSMNKYLGVGGTKSTPAGVDRGAAGGPRAAMGGVVPGRSVTIGNETRTGGDRNWRNNNPGNIEYGPFAIKYGAIGSDGRFAIFPTEEQGRMAQDALLKSKNYANLSLADAVKRYAPSNENDPKSYARQIMAQTGIDQNMRYADLTPEQQSRVLDAMKRIEGGRAGTISGPSGNYSSTMSGVNPPSAGSATQAQANANSEEVRSVNPLNKMVTLLTELVRTEQQAVTYQRQILQNSKA